MIELYFWTTPNGYKPLLFLEEAGIEYEIRPVNISKGEQFDPAFLRISPNNRIPAIVDHGPEDGGAPLAQFESGAVLQYLAEKTGKFIPKDARGRAEVLQWLNWQMGGIGPMFGQYLLLSITRPRISITPRSATHGKPNGFSACLTRGSETAHTWPASIRSPIWRFTPGCAAYSSASRGSNTCGAGHRRSPIDRPLSAPTKRARRSIPFPPSTKN